MKSRILVPAIITILLVSGLTSAIGLQNKTVIKLNEDDFDRWAVLIGISDYDVIEDQNESETMSLDAFAMYEQLIINGNGNWTDDNIMLLATVPDIFMSMPVFQYYLEFVNIDKGAKKQDILDALDWLEDNADDGDVVLFFFTGHGCVVEDDNGDEANELLDGRDEAICPSDISYDDQDNLINFIRDDDLSKEFDDISQNGIEGMFLIFDSCVCGGLINWRENKLHNGFSAGKEDFQEFIGLVNDSIEKAKSYSEELSQDIDTNGRVILSAAIPLSLTMSLYMGEEHDEEWLSFGRGVWKAIEDGKKTAEKISNYAISKWFKAENVLFTLLVHFIPKIWRDVWEYEIENLEKYGGIIFPLPLSKDDYPDNKPWSKSLTIIGEINKDSSSFTRKIPGRFFQQFPVSPKNFMLLIFNKLRDIQQLVT